MKRWYNRDWYGKEKPSREELIASWRSYSFVAIFCLIACFALAVMSIADPSFLGLTIVVGVCAIIHDRNQSLVKHSFYEFYGKRK